MLLIEGSRSKISSTIRYLTQSTWSHAALYTGLGADLGERDGEPLVLIEAELGEGVIASPLSKYATYNTRICRPVGLNEQDRTGGDPVRGRAHRARLRSEEHHRPAALFPAAAAGAGALAAAHDRARIGEPTRAICSTLIAQAFESVRYPVLPTVARIDKDSRKEILHIRHHSLFVPRDFDVSPFFSIVKPTIETGFDYKKFEWSPEPPPG